MLQNGKQTFLLIVTESRRASIKIICSEQIFLEKSYFRDTGHVLYNPGFFGDLSCIFVLYHKSCSLAQKLDTNHVTFLTEN